MDSMNTLIRLASRGCALLLILSALQSASAAAASVAGNDSLPLGEEKTVCVDGMILPAWRPIEDICGAERLLRGLVYFLALVYLFVGVSIASDKFMGAIEMITSLEKEVKVKKKNGQKHIVVVRVWNATVANLTLMALGSSAPEILLSIIEIIGKGFEAGELGPGTIVGSAAYNLFVIIALCIVVIPNGEVRKIKHLRVFFVTAFWSVFAYVWMYIILAVISPGRVDVWEAVVTFVFFPLTVGSAYMADRRLSVFKYMDKKYKINKRGVIVRTEGIDAHLELQEKDDKYRVLEETGDFATEDMRDFEEARKDYMNTIKELRKSYPHQNLDSLEIMAMEKVIDRGYKSRAFYRIQATRKILRRGDLIRKLQQRAQNELKSDLLQVDVHLDSEKESKGEIYFDPAHYTVMESCGHVMIRVVRRGNLAEQVFVDYETMDGSAETGSDYVAKKGTLSFPPGIDERRFRVQIIDDEVFQPDQHFYVRLSNVVGAGSLATPFNATVMILDDDHAGIFSFGGTDYKFVESVGTFPLSVHRYLGARGRVKVPYWTEDGTAKDGKEYEGLKGELIFENNETEKVIQLGIIEEGSYEKDVLFYVNLGEPQMVEEKSVTLIGRKNAMPIVKFKRDDELAALIQAAEAKAPEDLTEEDKMALLGRPKAGDIVRAQLRIKESKEFKNTVDKLVQRANASLLIGTSSWKEQFTEALTVSPGGDDNEDYEEGEEPKPSCGDYIMHFLTLFWKLIFAFIPPTDISGGYLCFFVSICCIGVVTAIIGDVASHFGCTLGIKDSVTAIVFVALGTSVPDTFASKVAAIQDKYADASVGNVTGSNAVNVFLGIGVAWTIAAIYHEIKGTTFEVEPGNLAFSVTLFCSEALIAILVLLLRRSKAVGGELGGPKGIKYFSGAILLGLWFIYLIMSTLEAYHVIPGF